MGTVAGVEELQASIGVRVCDAAGAFRKVRGNFGEATSIQLCDTGVTEVCVSRGA